MWRTSPATGTGQKAGSPSRRPSITTRLTYWLSCNPPASTFVNLAGKEYGTANYLLVNIRRDLLAVNLSCLVNNLTLLLSVYPVLLGQQPNLGVVARLLCLACSTTSSYCCQATLSCLVNNPALDHPTIRAQTVLNVLCKL